jgi:hypothetical protein
MITAKNIIELLEKEKFLVYFVLLWAGSFVFWNLSSLSYYAFHLYSALSVLALLSNLLEFLAGIMLGLLGFALLGMNVLKTITKEKLLVFFLLFWAGSFILWGIYDIIDVGPMSAEAVLRLLGALCDLGAGTVLALFSWKLLGAKEQPLPPPPV